MIVQIFCTILALCILSEAAQNSVKLEVINAAGAPIDLYWVNTFDDSLAYPDTLKIINSNPIRNGSESEVNTYEAHKFLVRFRLHIPNVEVSFFKGPRDETLIIRYDSKQGLTAKPPPRERKPKKEKLSNGGVKMEVRNHAGDPIDLFWVNTFNESLVYPDNLVKQTKKSIRNNSRTSINTFQTHQFVAKFVKERPGGMVQYVKGPRDETITIRWDAEKQEMTSKPTTKADELKEKIHDVTVNCSHIEDDGEFHTCVARGVAEDISKITESKSQMETYRGLLASRLRNYTCSDPMQNSTEPISTYNYTSGGRLLVVNTLLDMPNSKIWTVEDFLTEQECEHLIKHGTGRLKRATVAAADGSSVVSENRKAQQAGYHINTLTHPDKDFLWPLYMRVMGLTNEHSGLQLSPEGQEDFTIIQYNVDDQYTPHCDGDCDGSAHNPGGRVATAVLYCKVPELGGATTFSKSDIFVKPKPLSATFFSYKGDDGKMDEGYTEHSGCPVLAGEKWVTTAWMREGVSKAKPWTLFDPSGIPLLEAEAKYKTDYYYKDKEFEKK